MTFGWPVHPVPHQVRVPGLSVEVEHIPPDGGERHRITGCFGRGPSPYHERVALPRNVVSPGNDVLIGPFPRPATGDGKGEGDGATDGDGSSDGDAITIGETTFAWGV